MIDKLKKWGYDDSLEEPMVEDCSSCSHHFCKPRCIPIEHFCDIDGHYIKYCNHLTNKCLDWTKNQELSDLHKSWNIILTLLKETGYYYMYPKEMEILSDQLQEDIAKEQEEWHRNM